MHKKFIKCIVVFFISLGLFTLLEFGPSNFPLLFAATLCLSVTLPNFRKKLLLISFTLLLLMVLFYLLNNLAWANLIGAGGFGMLVLVIFTYIPELIKRGHIERY